MKSDTVLWRVRVNAADAAAAEAASAALELFPGALAAFEITDGGAWTVDLIANEEPPRAELAAALSLAGASASPLDWSVETVPERDWLAENQASFPPLEIGRFVVRGSHITEKLPPNRIPILVDAAIAFGTGEHPTTSGCLMALERVRRRPHTVLDMGTGTGILAIGAVKRWHCRALAVDIDAASVRVAAHNVGRNGVRSRITVAASPGYRSRRVRAGRPYEVIFANILARPLVAMAPSLAAALAPGGTAILSGLLARQEPMVRAAHRAAGLRLERRIAIAGWHTLVVRKGSGTGRAETSTRK